jgi:hypothetical protein
MKKHQRGHSALGRIMVRSQASGQTKRQHSRAFIYIETAFLNPPRPHFRLNKKLYRPAMLSVLSEDCLKALAVFRHNAA